MNKKAILALVLCATAALSLAGCEKLAQLPFVSKLVSKEKFMPVEGTIIAKVNGMPITLEYLEQAIQGYNELVGSPEAQITAREEKLAYLNEELVRSYLFYQEAKKQGLDKLPKNQELLRNLEINVLANQLLQQKTENILVTSSEVEDFYNLYKEQYRQTEERQVREIVLDNEAGAKETLIELLKGADFGQLARERSQSENASSGGSLGFIKKGQRGNDFLRFDEVVFSPALGAGQISNVFKDKRGYYIVKVELVRGGQAKSLSEVWDEIKRNVLFLKQQQKLQELSSQLMEGAQIVVYEERIK
ncbi:peptidyl-prolyl cis-trans isomerase [Candidatus Omnitrophota bacterium]